MGHLALGLFLAWLLDAVQFNVAVLNYQSIYNGFGAIDSIRKRRALAPMAYRVLVPWLVGWIEDEGRRLWAYEGVKVALMGAGLGAISWQFGPVAALIAAVLWVPTFRFDYWDVYAEFLALALTLTGRLPLALLGGAVGALSKETCGIIPFLYYSLTRDALGASFVALACWGSFVVVRARVGYKRMYCDRVMLRQNWEDLKKLREGWFLSPAFISCAITLTALVCFVTGNVRGDWVVPVLLVAGWVCGRIVEPRIFLSVTIWIAPVVARLLCYRGLGWE